MPRRCCRRSVPPGTEPALPCFRQSTWVYAPHDTRTSHEATGPGQAGHRSGSRGKPALLPDPRAGRRAPQGAELGGTAHGTAHLDRLLELVIDEEARHLRGEVHRPDRVDRDAVSRDGTQGSLQEESKATRKNAGIRREKEEQEARENSSVEKLARAEHKEDRKKAGSPRCQPVTDMVETMGIEPTTSGLQSPRSPN